MWITFDLLNQFGREKKDDVLHHLEKPFIKLFSIGLCFFEQERVWRQRSNALFSSGHHELTFMSVFIHLKMVWFASWNNRFLDWEMKIMKKKIFPVLSENWRRYHNFYECCWILARLMISLHRSVLRLEIERTFDRLNQFPEEKRMMFSMPWRMPTWVWKWYLHLWF